MVLDRVSEVPFWTTVKSAFPTEMMAAADCSSPLLVTSSVTTAITATATANARPSGAGLLRPEVVEDQAEECHGSRGIWPWQGSIVGAAKGIGPMDEDPCLLLLGLVACGVPAIFLLAGGGL